MNKLIFFAIFFITIFGGPILAIEENEKFEMYLDSNFNISNLDYDLIESAAFEGDFKAAYKIGRYYQFCLGDDFDKKIAGVFYYIARAFQHRQAYSRLIDIVDTLGIEKTNYDEYIYNIFSNFTPEEFAIMKTRNNLLSNFVLYHHYKLNNKDMLANKYKFLIYGKLSPRLLYSNKYISKNYPVGFTSQPAIESDELDLYKKLAFKGDIDSALLLFAYYRFEDSDKISKNYMRNLWAYISYLYGHVDAKKILEVYVTSDKSQIFKDLKENHIELSQGFEKNFVLYKYFDSVNEIDKANYYLKELQNSGIDFRLINHSPSDMKKD